MPAKKKAKVTAYEGKFKGRIQDRIPDDFNDLDRFTFVDATQKTSIYIEIPRQAVVIDEGRKELEMRLVPQDSKIDYKGASVVLNGRLFQIKKEQKGITAFFSSGGFQMRITSKSEINYKTELNDRYKIIIYWEAAASQRGAPRASRCAKNG